MAQNNPMGGGMAPPPASPANPTALNFQSDPNMRQQFKGFMSGLVNRPMSQPMAQPMSAPLPMYTPTANVDIFEPIQGFANGGGVTFSSGSDYSPGEGISIGSGTVQGGDTFGGRNDRRDLSGLNDPYEAEMIQTGKSFLDTFGPPSSGDDSGGDNVAVGPVAFGIGARPSVNLSARTMPMSGGDALSNEIGRRSNQTGYDDAPMNSRGLLTNQAQADAAMGANRGFGASGTTQSITGSPTASGYDDFGLDVLNLLGNVDLLDSDAVMRQALDSSARLIQDASGQVAVNEDMTGLPGGAAIVSSRPMQTIDEIMYNDTMMQTDMSPADMQRIQRERAAQDITRRGGTVDVNPDTGQLIANYPQTPSMLDTVPQSIPAPIGMPDEIRSMRNTFNDLDVFGPNVGGAPVTIGTPEPRPSTPFEQGEAAGERVSLGLPVGGGIDENLVDYTPLADARQEFDTKGARAPADQGFFGALMDTITGREYPTEEEIIQNIVDASGSRTTITGDKRRQNMSALDQLAKRAGQEGTGILGAFTNFGARNAANMYEDIVNNGYEPVYDRAGQIVATRVPGTNQLGRGSVEGRIPGANTGGGDGESAPRPVQAPQPSVADLVAAELAKLQPGATPGIAPTPATASPVPSASTPQAPAPLARPLGFGYGQIQGINPNLDNAANKFLSLLGGFAEGGEVKKFAKGGTAGDDLDAFGGAGPDVGFEGSGRGTFSGGSYSENPFDSGGDDDNVAPTVAPGSFITNQLSQDDGYNINTAQANQMNQQATRDKVARDIAMDEQRRSVEAAQRDQSLRASIDRLNQLQAQVNAPRQGIMGAAADLLGFGGQQNMLSADLAQGGVSPQNMTPNTSVMGYNDPTGQIQAPASMQSIVPGRDTAQSGLAGTMNVPTSRDVGFFDALSDMASNLPSLSQIGNRIMGTKPNYDYSNLSN